ncbi:WD repeat-containing protein 25 [Tenrec ecaudatus]|uniref:WD repeat-containing protein 25 n=1 Tax=Tenrec ecaudatus TaxID=94439 RepID=UPI003F5A7E72
MASLVAYDDSDSEDEPEPSGSRTATSQAEDLAGVASPPGQELIPGLLTPMGVNLRPTKSSAEAPGRLCEDLGGRRLPLVPLGRTEGRCGPSLRLQWSRKEPAVTTPRSEPPGPSVWLSQPRAGPLPLTAARSGGVRPSQESCAPDEPAFWAPATYEVSRGDDGSSFRKPKHEDCIIPYTPKRLRQSPAAAPALGGSAGAEPQGPSAGCDPRPAPRGLAPRVSEFIRPYLDCPSTETQLPRHLLFHLRGHEAPVNSVQWCPVPPQSHLLLSASMDKTFKVWDAVDTGHCLQTYTLHTEAVRAARWAPCGRRILSGGFDFALHLTDLETGTPLFSGQSDFRITTLKFHPQDHHLFVCGGFSSEIKAWDIRTSKVVRRFTATVQQTLDILFLRDGTEFLSSTDASSRDSADRTIIAWDFRTSAKISNQIFHERYTCPSLALHPREPVFLAQTNGNYLALFSAVWPYRMSRRRRYEGHKVEGYSVGCECSPDGDLLVTGSADGQILLYNFRTASRACARQGHAQACVGVTFHPVLPCALATCSWEGTVKVWH